MIEKKSITTGTTVRGLCFGFWAFLVLFPFQVSWAQEETKVRGVSGFAGQGDGQSDVNPSVIYGVDDRHDVYDEKDTVRLRQAAAVCALVRADELIDNGDGTFSLFLSDTLMDTSGVCSTERFADQPTLPFCTGWMVGRDIIATAGHCYDEGDIGNVYFVFGFEMIDAQTPVNLFEADQVDRGVQVVSREESDSTGGDYALIRVDRRLRVPGASPLNIRRSGSAAVGDQVGVIGHPSGLPLKIAFGDATRVRISSHPAYFEANLDTYGGNSGSPVFNASTGQVEGILVRGNDDYVDGPEGCRVSNRLIDNNGDYEAATRTTYFQQYVPLLDGVETENPVYTYGDTISMKLYDSEGPSGTAQVTLTTGAGDSEFLSLLDPLGVKEWEGMIPIDTRGAAVVVGDGKLQGEPDDLIVVSFSRPVSPGGKVVSYMTTARLDGVPPIVKSVDTASIGGNRITLAVETSESARVRVQAGVTCGSGPLFEERTDDDSTTNVVELTGLDNCTNYYVQVTAIDAAGNEAVWDNDGQCPVIQTVREVVTLEELFNSSKVTDWTHVAEQGRDTWDVVSDTENIAHTPPYMFYFDPGSGDGFTDVRLITPSFEAGQFFTFWHSFSIESRYDGAIIEISTDGGNTWTNLGPHIIQGGYNLQLNEISGDPLSGEMVWSGDANGPLRQVLVDLTNYSGPVQVAFRYVSDTSVAREGWWIDDVTATSSVPCESSVLHWSLH